MKGAALRAPLASRTFAFCILVSAICAPPSFGLPLYRDSLPNGLVVLTYEDHRLPICDVALVCRSGAMYDPAGKAGLANLTAGLLTKGTPGVSADSFAAIVEFLGAQLHGQADFDQSTVRLRVLGKDLAQGLDLLRDAVLSPALSSRELRLALDQSLAGARQRYDYPHYAVSAAFDRLAFGNHPYAWSSSGDTGTLRTITRGDVVGFHRTHYLPGNCFVVAVGDIDRTSLLAGISDRFGDWRPGAVPALDVPPLPEPAGVSVKLITRPDMNQTYVEFGHPGIAMSDPDLLPTRLMSYVLGGSPMSSRFGIAVREQAGLAYDVRCWFDRMRLRGAFHATVQTAKPREAVDLMLRGISAMYDSGATTAELMKAHNYYTGSFPLTYSSNRGKLGQVTQLELYRFGLDWLERFPDDVRAVTLEQVNKAARDHLRPGAYHMVIMGPVTKDDLGLTDVEWLD
jgi:zinc protease